MNRFFAVILLIGSLNVLPTPVHAQASGPVSYGVVIAGIGGEPEYVDKHWKWASGLYRALRDEGGFAPERLFLLAENSGSDPENPARKSSLEEIRQVFAVLAERMTANDLLVVILIGHGNANENDPKLSLPGPDLSGAELAGLLGLIKAGRSVVVHGGSSSAPFIKALRGPNHVILTATKSAGERLATVFPEYFLASLTPGNSDLDKDGRVSILEAFTYTRLKTAAWYEDEGRIATEHPLLDDNGDGVGSRDPGASDADGALARSITFGGKTATGVTTKLSSENQKQLTALSTQAHDLQRQIDGLKRAKETLPAETYASRLESLLVKLARLNRDMKTFQEGR